MHERSPSVREEATEKKIASVLSIISERNAATAIIGKVIAMKAGLSNSVSVRGCVNTLRCRCEPICSSSNDGYWLARSPDELSATIEELEKRVSAVNNAIAGLKEARVSMLAGRTVPHYQPHPESDISLDDILNQAD